MHISKRLFSKLRIEKSKQDSGSINLSAIPTLKKKNYYIVDIPLDGDAPKQYIKAYFYYKKCPRLRNVKYWNGYYAKFGGKSYPHESVTEYTINMVGEALGLKMNETRLVVANNQIRFLSKDFITRGRKKLIHGVELLHEYFEDKDFIDELNKDKKNRRELIMKERNKKVEFAPIYDTARGLLWSITEENILKMYNQYQLGDNQQINAFLKRSKPRFSFSDNPQSNHFDLVKFLSNYDESYRNVILSLITVKQEQSVLRKLKKTVCRYFSRERNFLINEILRLRFEKLRETVNV